MPKIKIVTFAHKRPDFIEIQYRSIIENIKDEFEFIVFNNSVDDLYQRDVIHKTCLELGLQCIDVKLVDELKYHGGENNFNGNHYTNYNLACSYPLVWSFKNYFENDDYVCIIDSDMFFIRPISLVETVKDIDICYIPQWRDSGKIHYIWNAFVVLNFRKNKNLRNLDWHPGSINNHKLDVGGQTHNFLVENSVESKFLTEFSIREITDKDGERNIHYIQDGSVNYSLTLKNGSLFSFIQTDGHLKGFSEYRSFPHESERSDFSDYIYGICKDLVEIIEKSSSNLPKPEHIAFIGFQDGSDQFLLHYKSGSNYLDFSTDDYNSKKTEGAKKIMEYIKNKDLS